MAKEKKKSPKEASKTFHDIMKASVKSTVETDMQRKADFVAEVKYKRTEDGGRRGFVASGYRGQIKFPFTERQTSGQQTFQDKERVYPGETATATIRVVSPQFFANALQEGMEFEIREGPIIVGFGKLLKILNQSLLKS